MEFYSHANVSLHPNKIYELLTIANLPEFCASISEVLAANEDTGEVYSVWGKFIVHREKIRRGIRFTFPACPNALAWTITSEKSAAGNYYLLVHCTINRKTHTAEMIESLEEFVADWQAGLAGIATT